MVRRLFLATFCSGLFLVLLCMLGCSRQSGQPPLVGGDVDAQLSCKSCHVDQWKEWYASPHATAWNSDAIQAAFHNFGFSRKCQSCHAPEPVLVTGLKQPPVLREVSLTSGVNCLSCHGLGESAGVAALQDNPDVACRPVKVPAIASSRLCGVCHTPIFEDWAESRYAREGRTCTDCHMRNAIDGKINHRCIDLLSSAGYQNSIEMKCFQDGEELIAEVTNRGVGHNFPGERHNRTLSVRVIQRDVNGEVQAAQKNLIKGITPFRGESTQDKIKVDETVQCRFPLVIAKGVAGVTLLWKRFPWLSDDEATVVAEVEVDVWPPR